MKPHALVQVDLELRTHISSPTQISPCSLNLPCEDLTAHLPPVIFSWVKRITICAAAQFRNWGGIRDSLPYLLRQWQRSGSPLLLGTQLRHISQDPLQLDRVV